MGFTLFEALKRKAFFCKAEVSEEEGELYPVFLRPAAIPAIVTISA